MRATPVGGCRVLMCLCVVVLVGGLPASPGRAADNPSATDKPDLRAALDRALAGSGWVEMPAGVFDVRYSGPTPAAAPGAPPSPAWYLTARVHPNTVPRAAPEAEAAFVRSVEAAHAGKTRLVECGEVLLVDPKGRVWAVAVHTPHLLRCYDGKKWSFRRADGLSAADDEPAAVAKLAAENKLPRPEPEKNTYRDLNDFGAWYPAACADRAGNLHFVGACTSRDAADRAARDPASAAAGGGVHTLRPDGSWSFFQIHPPTTARHNMRLENLRWTVHAPPAADAGAKAGDKEAEGGAAPPDLVTLAQFAFSDPVAEMHGHTVQPIPAGDGLRRQRWQDRIEDQPRDGPVYLARFDGSAWRFDRSSIGWGVYDAVWRAWPQPDGRAYLANRFGLWVQWPRNLPRARLDRLVADLFELDDARRVAAADTLASMGTMALDALRAAFNEASTDASRQRLNAVIDGAEKVARGEEDAVPVVGGRWRFFGAYPQATMPDGRFAFYCNRAVDVRGGAETKDCLVFFDPAADAFEVRKIDRGQWSAADYPDKRENEPAVQIDSTVIDSGGGLWGQAGFRVGKDGRIARGVPAGFKTWMPHFADADGRVYFRPAVFNATTLYFYRPPREGEAAPGAAPAVEKPKERQEKLIEHVRGVFRQVDLRPPWNAWAVKGREKLPDALLRLDGPEPTVVELPPQMRNAAAVVPLDGGCVAASTHGVVGFWDGARWDVAPDVRTLLERHGPKLAKMAPTYSHSGDTSAIRHGHYWEFQLMLASDGRGGLWAAEDVRADPAAGPRVGAHGRVMNRRVWHWDGKSQAITDVWSLLPMGPQRNEDGAVMTAERGRVLLVQLEPNMDVRPGGYWAVWHMLAEDLVEPRKGPPMAHKPGLAAQLLAARGPNTVFSMGLWADRQGWVWSPTLSPAGDHWWRRRLNLAGATPITRVSPAALVQGAEGPTWCVAGNGREPPMVWADVGPVGDEPKHYSRMTWVGAHVPGMGAASRVAVAPDGKTYLLHEGGCSLLRVKKLAAGEKPKLATQTTAGGRMIGPHWSPPNAAGQAKAAGGGAEAPPAEVWEIEEVARHKWDGPRNDFDRVAFDETGVWFLPAEGPLVRAPLPRE